ncbi:MAG: hypothetical protein ACM30G_11265 [Micromonosporaceae bacterium]
MLRDIVDFALVAMVILRTLEVFASPLGTWILFALIFFVDLADRAHCRPTAHPAPARRW